jgi:hypothetical protein
MDRYELVGLLCAVCLSRSLRLRTFDFRRMGPECWPKLQETDRLLGLDYAISLHNRPITKRC